MAKDLLALGVQGTGILWQHKLVGCAWHTPMDNRLGDVPVAERML